MRPYVIRVQRGYICGKFSDTGSICTIHSTAIYSYILFWVYKFCIKFYAKNIASISVVASKECEDIAVLGCFLTT